MFEWVMILLQLGAGVSNLTQSQYKVGIYWLLAAGITATVKSMK